MENIWEDIPGYEGKYQINKNTAEIISLNYNNTGKIRFRSQMNKVKDRLYKKGFVIRSIYNIGYYILKPNQVSSYTYRNFIVRPTNQYKKAKTILENLNNKNFNNFENLEFESTKSLNKKIIKTTNDLLNSNEYKNLAKNIKQNYGGNNGRK